MPVEGNVMTDIYSTNIQVERLINGRKVIRAASAYMGGTEQLLFAAEFGHIQLLNPAASGKIILLRKWQGQTNGQTPVSIRLFDTALITLAPQVPTNKLVGGVAAVGEIRKQTNASLLGTSAVSLDSL